MPRIDAALDELQGALHTFAAKMPAGSAVDDAERQVVFRALGHVRGEVARIRDALEERLRIANAVGSEAGGLVVLGWFDDLLNGEPEPSFHGEHFD
jgi:hypothetical protein